MSLLPMVPDGLRVINPVTAELVELHGPTENLAEFLADMREHESLCREAKKLVTREVVSRMDKGATWTLHVAGLKLSAPSPKPTEEFDGPGLREALLSLVEDGSLSIEAVDAAVEVVVTYEPRKRGIEALRKLGGRVADVVNAFANTIEKDRYVKVERS